MAQSRCTSRQTSTAKLIAPPCVDSFLNIASMANGQKWSISPMWVGTGEIYQLETALQVKHALAASSSASPLFDCLFPLKPQGGDNTFSNFSIIPSYLSPLDYVASLQNPLTLRERLTAQQTLHPATSRAHL